MSGIRRLVDYPRVWVVFGARFANELAPIDLASRVSLPYAPFLSSCNKAELHRPAPSRYFNTRGQFYTDLTPSSGAYRLGADPMEVVIMRTQIEYRKLAGDCVCLAKTASTPQQRVTLLDISHIWLKLADRVGSEPAGGPKIGLGGTAHIWRNPPRLATAS